MSEVDSFVAKWLAHAPPYESALLFCPKPQRRLQALWATLVHEIDEAAFALSDAGVSRTKLAWWAEEFELAAHGEARHPLTRELFAQAPARDVDARRWPAVAQQALICASNDGATPRDTAAVLETFMPYARALAGVESHLFRVEVTPRWLAAAVVLRQWPTGDSSAGLRWPLHLRARHQLVGDADASPRLQQDFAGELLQLQSDAESGSALRRCITHVDRWRLQQLAAGKPLQWPGRWRGLWLNWRAARSG